MIKILMTVDSRYLEHTLSRISRYLELFPGPFSIYGLLPYKMSCYVEIRYLELFTISN